MKIYIAGPYSADTKEERLANTHYTMDAWIALVKKGHTPFCPHLYHYMDEHAKLRGIEFSYSVWMEQDEAWLRECDALLFLGPSPGANKELAIAIEDGMGVYYNINDVPEAN